MQADRTALPGPGMPAKTKENLIFDETSLTKVKSL